MFRGGDEATGAVGRSEIEFGIHRIGLGKDDFFVRRKQRRTKILAEFDIARLEPHIGIGPDETTGGDVQSRRQVDGDRAAEIRISAEGQ